MKTVLLLLLTISIGRSLLQQKDNFQKRDLKQLSATTVNFCDLLANPSRYDQQIIRTRAIYRYGGEDTVDLYHPSCVEKGTIFPVLTDEFYARTKSKVQRKFSRQKYDSGTVGAVLVGKLKQEQMGKSISLQVELIEQATYLAKEHYLPDKLPVNVLRKIRLYVTPQRKQ